MYILGIDDGHDAGACIVEDGKIIIAVNEERLNRKKLYIGFPEKSIKTCLDFLEIKPQDIEEIAYSGSQLSRTLERAIPNLSSKVYAYRRRTYSNSSSEKIRRLIFLNIGTIGTNSSLKFFTKLYINKILGRLGFKEYNLHLVDHHSAHAASAIFTSGFKKCLCITLDGCGDGLSGTVNIFNNEEIDRISSIPVNSSLGIFYENVTTLLGMRGLEDSGKVMSLADYWHPQSENKNKMSEFFKVNGLKIIAKYGITRKYLELEKILRHCEREHFAYMAQKTLEKYMLQLFSNAINETGIKKICWSGGIAHNIKANRMIRLKSGLKECFVFPHMGDGGLPVGAALHVDWLLNGIKSHELKDAYLGPEYSETEIENELKKYKVHYELQSDVAGFAGDLISEDNFLLWFQGRMEYGPRALGHRSILAPAWSLEVKNDLNMKIKRRPWYQPFCPSLLVEEANKFFEDYDDHPDKFMTMGFMTRSNIREKAQAVIHVDGSSRPQMVCDEDDRYKKLLKQIKKNTGNGIMLNTSFNIHGEPIVCSPRDALNTMIRTKAKYMILGNFFVEFKN